jgi:hypothetical protein
MARYIACNTPEAEADAVMGSPRDIDEHAMQGMTWHDRRFAR